jgi:hypothetical protein
MSLKLRTIAFCAAAAMLPGTAEAAGIHVLSAFYGTPSAGRVCDAGAPVASMCEGRSACSVDVRNLLCGDPDFFSVKQVDITYSCGRARYSTSASEYSVSTLVCR